VGRASPSRIAPMGTLTDSPAIRPTGHIFVGSKAPWFTITDDLPQYHEHATTAGASNGEARADSLLRYRLRASRPTVVFPHAAGDAAAGPAWWRWAGRDQRPRRGERP